MATLKELLERKAEIEKQIDDAARNERAAAIAKVKALMAEHGLSVADLGSRGSARLPRGAGSKVAAKYRNAATGQTWSGRGLRPNWLKDALASGRKLEDFAV